MVLPVVVRRMNAIIFPLGEKAGRRSSGPAVSPLALVAPFAMSTIQIFPVFALLLGPRR